MMGGYYCLMLSPSVQKQWKRPSSYKNAFSHSNSTCLGFHVTWGRGQAVKDKVAMQALTWSPSPRSQRGGNSAGWLRVREEELATSFQRTGNGKQREVSADRMRVIRLLYLRI